MEIIKENKDLTQTKNTYANCIALHLEEINRLAEDEEVWLDDMKDKILEFIEPATDTPAKRRFIIDVNNCKYKIQLTELVYNSYLKGAGLGMTNWRNNK